MALNCLGMALNCPGTSLNRSGTELSQHGIELSRTLFGSSDECDIVIRSPGLRARHAVIEYCPRTQSFWLRQLDPRRERMDFVPPPPPYPYEDTVVPRHSSDNARQQVLRDAHSGSIIELHSMDTLRFGKGPEAVEFVFKMPPIHHHHYDHHPTTENTSARLQSRSGSFGARPLRKKWSLDRDGHISLPVVGSRIQPKAHADRFTRPNASQSNHRLCQLRLQQHQQQQNNNCPKASNGVTRLRGRSLSASRLISVGDCAAKVQPRVDTPALCKMGTNGATNSQEYANSSGSSVDSDEFVRVAAGHKEEELLRRVRRLQAELSRRDAELARLRETLANGEQRRARGDGVSQGRDSVANGEGQVGTVDERTTNMDKELSSLSSLASSVDHQQLQQQQQQQQLSSKVPPPAPASGQAKRVPQKRGTEMSSAHALLLGTRATDIFYAVCAEELSVLNTK
uniref:FHA domain-containing protein n=1 Tax=Globodera rostochiensis TaxID=31243 RepID=A0A914GZW1_GLORO